MIVSGILIMAPITQPTEYELEQFMSTVSELSYGGTRSRRILVTIIHREDIAEVSSKIIAEHSDKIAFGHTMSFLDLLKMFYFIDSAVQKGAVMWSLLSDEDRKKVASGCEYP